MLTVDAVKCTDEPNRFDLNLFGVLLVFKPSGGDVYEKNTVVV